MKATGGVTIIQTQPTYGSLPIVFADVPVTFTDAHGNQVHKTLSTSTELVEHFLHYPVAIKLYDVLCVSTGSNTAGLSHWRHDLDRCDDRFVYGDDVPISSALYLHTILHEVH